MQNGARISCAEVFTISQVGLRFVRESAREAQFLSFRRVESEIVRGHCTRNLLLHVTRVTVSPGKPLSKASLVREAFFRSFLRRFFACARPNKQSDPPDLPEKSNYLTINFWVTLVNLTESKPNPKISDRFFDYPFAYFSLVLAAIIVFERV